MTKARRLSDPNAPWFVPNWKPHGDVPIQLPGGAQAPMYGTGLLDAEESECYDLVKEYWGQEAAEKWYAAVMRVKNDDTA